MNVTTSLHGKFISFLPALLLAVTVFAFASSSDVHAYGGHGGGDSGGSGTSDSGGGDWSDTRGSISGNSTKRKNYYGKRKRINRERDRRSSQPQVRRKPAKKAVKKKAVKKIKRKIRKKSIKKAIRSKDDRNQSSPKSAAVPKIVKWKSPDGSDYERRQDARTGITTLVKTDTNGGRTISKFIKGKLITKYASKTRRAALPRFLTPPPPVFPAKTQWALLREAIDNTDTSFSAKYFSAKYNQGGTIKVWLSNGSYEPIVNAEIASDKRSKPTKTLVGMKTTAKGAHASIGSFGFHARVINNGKTIEITATLEGKVIGKTEKNITSPVKVATLPPAINKLAALPVPKKGVDATTTPLPDTGINVASLPPTTAKGADMPPATPPEAVPTVVGTPPTPPVVVPPTPPVVVPPAPPVFVPPAPPVAVTPPPPVAVVPTPPAVVPTPPVFVPPAPPVAVTPTPPVAVVPTPPAVVPTPPVFVPPAPPVAVTPTPPVAVVPPPPVAVVPPPPPVAVVPPPAGTPAPQPATSDSDSGGALVAPVEIAPPATKPPGAPGKTDVDGTGKFNLDEATINSIKNTQALAEKLGLGFITDIPGTIGSIAGMISASANMAIAKDDAAFSKPAGKYVEASIKTIGAIKGAIAGSALGTVAATAMGLAGAYATVATFGVAILGAAGATAIVGAVYKTSEAVLGTESLAISAGVSVGNIAASVYGAVFD